jgi:hypothetical protein
VGYQKKIRLTIIATLLAICGYAQQAVTVKGIVVDSATLKPLSYVNVYIKKLRRGTMTDAKGNFLLAAHPADTLQFSMMGYRSLELPVRDWEPSVVMMTEIVTILKSVTIEGESGGGPYQGLFDEENAKLARSKRALPFYYAKDKKDKILLGRAKSEQIRVKHYVDLLVKDDHVKNELIKKYRLTENEYYDLLARFNQKNYAVMYYLTDSELLSMLYKFYDANAPN